MESQFGFSNGMERALQVLAEEGSRSCPSPDTGVLFAVATGKAQMGPCVALHLDHCGACQQRYDQLAPPQVPRFQSSR